MSDDSRVAPQEHMGKPWTRISVESRKGCRERFVCTGNLQDGLGQREFPSGDVAITRAAPQNEAYQLGYAAIDWTK